MLWVKTLHVGFMVTWFAGLFYLPRLFVYHAMANPANTAQIDTFRTMERKLLVMMHIGGTLTAVFGGALLLIWLPGLLAETWMQMKLLLVLALFGYHLWCMRLAADLAHARHIRSHRWYRVFNEVPVLFLFAVTALVIVRPAF